MIPRLNKVAAEISAAFFKIRTPSGKQPRWVVDSQPLLDALLELRSVKDFYGVDSGEKIIMDFLHKVGDRWHGPDSDRLRGYLREHIYNAKEQNAGH